MSSVPASESYFHPPRIWEGQPAFIVGGGPSLKNTDLSCLYGKNVLGVNTAYQLGNWVKVVFYGDEQWIKHYSRLGALEFPGWLVTASVSPFTAYPKVMVMHREISGFATGSGRLAWNMNSGACSINLAYHLGANPVFLVGFDMKVGTNDAGEKINNWHPNPLASPVEKKYGTFLRAFSRMKREMDAKVPQFKVLNATPGSALTLFPMVNLEEVAK